MRGVLLVVGLIAILAPARPPAADVSPGATACTACHAGADGGRGNLFVEQFRSNEFIRLNESTTWSEQDPHSRAFTALSGDLGKQMSKRLGYDVTAASQCLTCHAV